MTVAERIDNIYDNLKNIKLSDIVSMLMPISIECKDYEGYCVLLMLSLDISYTKTNIPFLSDGFHTILSKEGLDNTQIQDVIDYSLTKYSQICSVDSNQNRLLCTSIKTDEEQIERIENSLNSLKANNNTLTMELYNDTKAKLSHVNSYVFMKCTEYRTHQSMKKGITDMKNENLNSKNVFIIHGRDEAKRRELESLLKDEFNLNPIVLLEQPNEGETVFGKFEKIASCCTYAFALFTHDDIVNANTEQYKQVRPNVLFEIGWFLGRLGYDRVCYLEKKCEEGKIPSDLQGILTIQFNDDVKEKYLDIKKELKAADII